MFSLRPQELYTFYKLVVHASGKAVGFKRSADGTTKVRRHFSRNAESSHSFETKLKRLRSHYDCWVDERAPPKQFGTDGISTPVGDCVVR